MRNLPKHLQTICSITHGILLAVAGAGAVSMLDTTLGHPLSPKLLGDICFFGGLFASSVTVYLNSGGLFLQESSRQ